jgi:isopenicillin N synthase-like dioxygenase
MELAETWAEQRFAQHEAWMGERTIPVIDIAPFLSGDARAKKAISTQVDDTLRRIGFLIIAAHGVDPALTDRMHAVSRGFFILPLEERPALYPPVAAGAHYPERMRTIREMKDSPDLVPVAV